MLHDLITREPSGVENLDGPYLWQSNKLKNETATRLLDTDNRDDDVVGKC